MFKRVFALSATTLVAAALLSVALAASAKKAAVGEAAPAFSLSDQDGKTVSLGDFSGKIVVLEWTNPQCPFVVRHYEAKTMTSLASKYQDKDVAWVAINSTKSATQKDNKAWATQHNVGYPILDDSSGAVAKSYGAKTTPHMFIIDKDGKLVYAGAIDNDPDGKKGASAENYVARALDEVLAGKPVSESQTKPYGCGVKQ